MKLALALLVFAALGSAPARADERFAIIVGSNRGAAGDAELGYAENDAAKVADVLQRVGAFRAENVAVLPGPTAAEVRRAIITQNDRIRRLSPTPALLFVFYSGHADSAALHLGTDELPMDELQELVRGSAASFRILVVDSCRSGVLTKVKGGRRVEGGAALVAPPDPSASEAEGFVVLTAAAAGEDAQESESLKSSFFTHYFVSGLLGGADADGDRTVTLQEVYRFAFQATVTASSATLAGTQHPPFRYDVKGKGDIVLSSLDAAGLASVVFPAGIAFLLFSDDGGVVGEIGRGAAQRELVVSPGTYQVRGRGDEQLLDGAVTVGEGETRVIDVADLDRTEYARVVRKGGGEGAAVAVSAGYAGRSAWLPQTSACHGGTVSLIVELRQITVAPWLALCRGTWSNETLQADETGIAADLAATYVVDLPRVSVGLGALAGASYLRQDFATRGSAPDRAALGPHFGLLVTARAQIAGPVFLESTLEGKSAIFTVEGERDTPVVLAWSLGVGGYL